VGHLGKAQGTIVLTNDDGIGAPGLAALARRFSLAFGGRVIAVAPSGQRSAVGHGITLREPLTVRALPCGRLGMPSYAVSGTPADCVKLAVQELSRDRPLLVCSGVNSGPNLGTDVFYSGTVSAAIEAAIMGLPGMAISLAVPSETGFELASELAEQLAWMIIRRGMPPNTLLNVNVPPPSGALPGRLRITRLGTRRYKNVYSVAGSGDGVRTYVLAGEDVVMEGDEGTDVGAIARGEVSITPIHLDLTNHAVLASMEEWLR
jgi:5'-nucleotidase